MKKLLSFILVIVMIAGCMPFSNVFATDISVKIDGAAQNYDVMPVIENGRTLVPMRAIFEALGANVEWDNTSKTVTGTKGETKVSLQIGNTSAKVNQTEVTLDVPGKIISDRTMVPVRFISESLGCNVGWDDTSKTVIINTTNLLPGTAKLISEMHRKIPTEFEKSNDLTDIIHFPAMTAEEQNAAYNAVRESGVVVCTEDKFLESIGYGQEKYGKAEVIDAEGMPFKKSLKITCTDVPEKSADFIIRTKATPEKNPGEGVKKEDVMLLAFRMRTISTDATTGLGKIQVQIEHPTTYVKALFEFVTCGDKWEIVYLPFSGVKDATSIGIRGGFAKQVVELGGIEIINLGPGYDIQKLPKTGAHLPELEPDAEWRKAANERIETLRKGDFSVIVKDKEGNVVPDAEVEFDMFEHEFQFGNAFNPSIISNENYAKNHEMLFNAGVVEHSMKWAPFEENPADARKQVDAAVKAGVKYLRGHSIFWERMLASNGTSYLTPKYMEDPAIMAGDRAKYDELCEKHAREVCEAYYGEVCDWDVVNEIKDVRHFAKIFGPDPWKSQFEWARKYAGQDVDLYYNDYAQFNGGWEDTLMELINTGAQFDGIGFQSHYDGIIHNPTKLIEKYASLENYGDKKLKVTEFSCSIPDRTLQANFTRDMLITAFAEDDMTGFIYWGFWDGANFMAFSPFFDADWNLKPAGKQYIDLVYNKWWTRDAKATTDANGKATIRGYYGDYDVTVNANGKTQTAMVAYHKGYENVLEITLN